MDDLRPVRTGHSGDFLYSGGHSLRRLGSSGRVPGRYHKILLSRRRMESCVVEWRKDKASSGLEAYQRPAYR